MELPSISQALAVDDVPISVPLDRYLEPPKVGEGMALLALSHTPTEHRLYEVMHIETIGAQRACGSFSIRRLLSLSGLRSYGSVKRGCAGLLQKRSIESVNTDESNGAAQYRVFSPEEIFARRLAAGLPPYPEEIKSYHGSLVFGRLIHHVATRSDLTRREALVVLCCAEGLTNAEIGNRLGISEQTVKSHLRQVFDKFGVNRRTELLSRLLTLKTERKRKRRLSMVKRQNQND